MPFVFFRNVRVFVLQIGSFSTLVSEFCEKVRVSNMELTFSCLVRSIASRSLDSFGQHLTDVLDFDVVNVVYQEQSCSKPL